MTFSKLVEILSNDYRIDILSQGEDIEIQDIALIDNKHDRRKSTLYFGYVKQLQVGIPLPAQCILAQMDNPMLLSTGVNASSIENPTLMENFDLIESLDLVENLTLTENLTLAENLASVENLALVEESSLFTLFNEAKTLIETTYSKGLFEELTALADQTNSIETVLDAASVRLGNSLLFCDMNFKIIASSSSIPVLDPLWKENIKQGYCSYEFIKEVKELDSIKNAAPTTSAVEVTCSVSPYRKLSSKVFHNRMQVGFLLMIESENKFLPYHYEMLSTVSHIISYTIAYYRADLFEESSLYQQLLYDLLIGTPSKDLLPRLTELHFPDNILVLFIRPTRFLGREYLKRFVNLSLKTQIPGAHVTYHKNGIVAMIPLKEHTEIDYELSETLNDFTEKEHVRIGISNSFSNIENFASHYEQAYVALELGQKLNPDESICRYLDYQVFDLFSEVKNPDLLGRFCHPALVTLRQYDHQNNTQLYETLCIYLDKGCSIKLTSESLYIHRNSLVYRINRIVELCHINLEDVNTLFLLRLSFLIDRYNGLNALKTL